MVTKLIEASAQDIPVIQDMADACYMIAYRGIHSEEQNLYMKGLMYSTESLLKQFNEEGSRYLIAYCDNIPSGYCAFKPYSGNEHGEGSEESSNKPIVYLDKLYILPDMQKKGIGRVLVESVIKIAESAHPKGCTIRLDVNRLNSARSFYERLGFSAKREWDAHIGEGFFMNGCTMEKEI